MAFRFFRIPVAAAEEWEEELNGFLRSHRVLQVDRRFVDDGRDSYWSICIDYLPAGAGKPGQRPGIQKERTDYREILSEEAFARFVRLRQLRKQIANEESIPVYVVFTNAQLAEIAKSNSVTRATLEQVEGVGGARAEKYGDRVLQLLHSAAPSPPTQ
jgi:superfamily II DNA helicase RecQ